MKHFIKVLLLLGAVKTAPIFFAQNNLTPKNNKLYLLSLRISGATVKR